MGRLSARQNEEQHEERDREDAVPPAWSAADAVRAFREVHDRLESPEPHEWVDMNRERAYHAQTTMLTRFAEQGARSPGEFLYRLLSKDGKENVLPPREMFDVLRLETRTYPELSTLAGIDITRTMFVVQDPAVYKMLEEYFGVPAGKTHGLVVPPQAFSAHTSWKDTGITLVFDSSDAEDTMEHETRHSMDPNLRERENFDNIISELFANYGLYISSGREDWDRLMSTLATELYFDTYRAQIPVEDVAETDSVNYKQWQYLILRAVTRIRAMREILCSKRPKQEVDIEIQQMLVQMETLDELLFLEIRA